MIPTNAQGLIVRTPTNQKYVLSPPKTVVNLQSGYSPISRQPKQYLRDKPKRLDNSHPNRGNNSPDPTRYRSYLFDNRGDNNLLTQTPKYVKSTEYMRTMMHHLAPEKYFQADRTKKRYSQTCYQMGEIRMSQYEQENIRNKKSYGDTAEYVTLHSKLDSIYDKISDMKLNLLRKKYEKLKMLEKQRRYRELVDQPRMGSRSIDNIKLAQQYQNKAQQYYNKPYQYPKPQPYQNNIPIQKPYYTKYPKVTEKCILNNLVTQMPQQDKWHPVYANPYAMQNNTYYVSEIVKAFSDERSLARDHLFTSLTILKMLYRCKRVSEEEANRRRVTLPYRKGYEDRKTIIFDLDETLIHCNDSQQPTYDVKLPIKVSAKETVEAKINIRPYAKEILRNLSQYFEIIVFTASHSCYANTVLDYLDPEKRFVHHRLFREHCYQTPEGMFVKDLRIINRDLRALVLVDNAAYSYAWQLDNGIPILPYYHGSVDFELRALQDYLMKLVNETDVRLVNRSTFKLYKYTQYNSVDVLANELYVNADRKR